MEIIRSSITTLVIFATFFVYCNGLAYPDKHYEKLEDTVGHLDVRN